MYTSCDGATIVMTIVSQNLALNATMVSDVTMAQTDITTTAP